MKRIGDCSKQQRDVADPEAEHPLDRYTVYAYTSFQGWL